MQTTTTIRARDLDPQELGWALRFEAGTAAGLCDAVELLVSGEEFLTGPMLEFITVEHAGAELTAWVEWEAAAEAIDSGLVEPSAEIAAAWLMAAHLAAGVAIDLDETLRAMDLHACAIARDALGAAEQTATDQSFWHPAFGLGMPGRDTDAWQLAGLTA
ncbi:hypothetical protein GCM10027447_01880 [Glycomyces halotolerans]